MLRHKSQGFIQPLTSGWWDLLFSDRAGLTAGIACKPGRRFHLQAWQEYPSRASQWGVQAKHGLEQLPRSDDAASKVPQLASGPELVVLID